MKRASILATILVLCLPSLQLDRIREDQWHLHSLRVADAHKYSLGEGVTVAVIDTGVSPHRDLRKNLLTGADVTGSIGIGHEDTDSHGTGMAGLIAAHGSTRDEGAMGIAPSADILPIRAALEGTQSTADNLAAGIEWAVAHQASVVNISLSGGPSARLRSAIDLALQHDVVVVAAAGNRPAAASVGFPARLEGVVAVGAVDRSGSHIDASVAGPEVVISAPGVDIYSTSYGDKYRKGTGTSDATAIVAGAAALVRSKYPELSAREVVHRLTATATDKGPPGRDEMYGYGVLNLVAALTADVPPLSPGVESSATSSVAKPGREGGGRLFPVVVAILVAAGGGASLVLWLRYRRRKGSAA
ncbi:type VII secretion-associated serine protease mycosin [Phytohabitans aurantiacus]|uniref:Type VII secretion-associated serine protease n=1 Tax=Phytohabitans aurantiacus TaxID=3016789 RepID=A0ABQ5RAN4_9ACTN|nr:type VII secretion-associated serine protease mycosin [Phytohabitans aurantiacus]GLI03812.1 type VII secretion-associated serine protease [Phytohabitans aurantiacus]